MKPVKRGPTATPRLKHIVLIPITRARFPGRLRSALIPPIDVLSAAETIPRTARSPVTCHREVAYP